MLATTPVTTNVLAVGTHEIVLWLDDTLPYGTNSASVTVEVITPAQAVTILFSMLDNSNLSARSLRPLEATLGAALAAFESGRFTPAANQLTAFQNKVRAQVAPFDPVLAGHLLAAAQSIIDPRRESATLTGHCRHCLVVAVMSRAAGPRRCAASLTFLDKTRVPWAKGRESFRSPRKD